MESNKHISALASIFALAFTALFVYFMKEKPHTNLQFIMYSALVLVFNFFIFYFVFEEIDSIMRVYRLPGVKLNSYAYYSYPLMLLSFSLLANMVLLRLGGKYLSRTIQVAIILVTFALFVLTQLGGAWPEVKEEGKKLNIRVDKSGAALKGFDLLGSMSGKYNDGLIFGNKKIPYDMIKTMYGNGKSLILEGNNKKKFEAVINSEKTKTLIINHAGERLSYKKK